MLFKPFLLEEQQTDIVQIERDANALIVRQCLPPCFPFLRCINIPYHHTRFVVQIGEDTLERFHIIRCRTDVQKIDLFQTLQILLQALHHLLLIHPSQTYRSHGRTGCPHIAYGITIAGSHLHQCRRAEKIDQTEQQAVHLLPVMRESIRWKALCQRLLGIVRTFFIDNGWYQEEIRRRMYSISATMTETPAPIPYSSH